MSDEKDGNNVLFELQPGLASDSAYHYGADISMLSQFGAEEEVLFPPCCLMSVILTGNEEATVRSQRRASLSVSRMQQQGEKAFVVVGVKPSFV
jgi:hypothetical protein